LILQKTKMSSDRQVQIIRYVLINYAIEVSSVMLRMMMMMMMMMILILVITVAVGNVAFAVFSNE